MFKIQQVITYKEDLYNIIINKNSRNIQLNSSRPKAEAEKIFSQLPPNTPTYFIGGLGFGYLLELILMKTNSLCIVYEPNSLIFETTLKTRPLLKTLLLNKRILFVQDTESLIQIITDKKLNDISFTIQRAYSELFPEQFVQIKESISAGIRKHEVGNATLLRFGKLWTKNVFRNMHRFFTSQKLLPYKSWAMNKPAIIIGAGPSLEEAIPYLKVHQNNAILIACDTALPMLYHKDISPDFVITVDPQEKNSLYLRYTPNKNHILIADPSIHDSSFENYSDSNIILMDCIFPLYQSFQSFWGSCGLLASGGSVSTSAFDFARIIKADPIIMVGQDLAFTQRKTHNQGNILAEFSRNLHYRLNSFHQNQANTTYTSHTQQIKGRKPNTKIYADARLMLFRDWFSQEIPKTPAQVIIAGMDGAYLEKAHHMTVQEAFVNLQKPISKELPIQHFKTNKIKYSEYIEDLFRQTSYLIPICSQILINVNKAYKNKNLEIAIKESTKLQNLLTSSEYKDISPLIAISIQESIQATMKNNPTYQEQLDSIVDIVKSTFEGIQQLHKLIQKNKKFIFHI